MRNVETDLMYLQKRSIFAHDLRIAFTLIPLTSFVDFTSLRIAYALDGVLWRESSSGTETI
jgi:hypothetical protein